MLYEALFYDGWGAIPAYYLLDGIEGDTPEQALAANLVRITEEVRSKFGFAENDVSDMKIQEAIYVLRDDGLVSV